ncbi:hypothetical protein ACTHOQ_17985 [Solibacillus silvestris]|uniref:hypothetical protein n=1 Tax=Solibacillus silvestris TaxID=76853 RepID=UPI003F8049DD
MMKILHTPVEIAGQVSLSVRGLRAIGLKADSLTAVHPFKYKNEWEFIESKSKVIKLLDRVKKVNEIRKEYDIIHYHFGTSILPKYLDVKILKKSGIKVFSEFWGSDVRLPLIEAKRNPFFVNSYNEDEQNNIEKMKRWSDLTDGVAIFSDHTFNEFLNPYFEKVHIIGQRVDTELYQPVYPVLDDTNEPVIVHAPSQQAFKGTVYVEKAIENLQNKGLKFKYKRVEKMSNQQAIEIYKTADIVIDQLCGGAHGIFACEAMALGKPVICYILPEFLSGYPEGLPIINANPDTVEEILANWIQAPAEERYKVGMQGRKYAEKVHDIKVVAEKLAQIYR